MATPIQLSLEIPAEIAKKLDTGDLIRYGSVVRDAGGAIVKHLEEIPGPSISAKEVVPSVSSSLGKLKVAGKGLLTTTSKPGVIGGVVVGATVVYFGIAWIKQAWAASRAEGLATSSTAELDTAINEYLRAAQKGALTVEVIDRLSAAIEAAEGDADSRVEIAVNVVTLVENHTKKLVEANNLAIESADARPDVAPVARLKASLDSQRRIFANAA